MGKKTSGWAFFWMGTTAVLLAAMIAAGSIWANWYDQNHWGEISVPLFERAPRQQRQARNFGRQYSVNLIQAALEDFETKHGGQLPDLEDITRIDDQGRSLWHYDDIEHIDNHDLATYDYDDLEIGSPANLIPTADKSFYGTPPSLPAQAHLPDSENIHIWLGYACNNGPYDHYASVMEQSAPTNFAIVYSLELEYGNEPPEQFVRCQGRTVSDAV